MLCSSHHSIVGKEAVIKQGKGQRHQGMSRHHGGGDHAQPPAEPSFAMTHSGTFAQCSSSVQKPPVLHCHCSLQHKQIIQHKLINGTVQENVSVDQYNGRGYLGSLWNANF